jgi:hypothetical protein
MTFVDDFQRDGYAVVRGVLKDDDFPAVRDEYARLLNRRAERRAGLWPSTSLATCRKKVSRRSWPQWP